MPFTKGNRQGKPGPMSVVRVPAPKVPEETKQELVTIWGDPVAMTQGVFGHSHWGVQKDILRAVSKHRRVAAKACHSSGKTFTAADAALWWVSYHKKGIVITTAPTWIQVQKLLWAEIKTSLEDSKIKYPEATQTELKLGEKNYIMGLSTNEGVRFQGFHGDILIIADEAPGVRPDIFDAIEGIRAGGKVHLLLLGNPLLASGPFYDAFSSQQASWKTFTISAFNTPNLSDVYIDNGKIGVDHYVVGDQGEARGPAALKARDHYHKQGKSNLLEWDPTEGGPLDDPRHNPRPYLTTKRWVYEKYEDWGPGTPLWESKVLGQFPAQSETALIALTWLEQSALPWINVDVQTISSLRVGIDVAGPGEDETSLYILLGNNVVLERHWSKPDPRGDLVAALLPYKAFLVGEKGSTINVDEVGIGYHVVSHLKDQGFNVRGINVGERARDPERFANLKAELYWGLREKFKAGEVGNLTDEKTKGQLSSIQYTHNPKGQIVIESKEDMRKRGVKSPDRAEAFMLANAKPRAKTSLNPKDWPKTKR